MVLRNRRAGAVLLDLANRPLLALCEKRTRGHYHSIVVAPPELQKTLHTTCKRCHEFAEVVRFLGVQVPVRAPLVKVSLMGRMTVAAGVLALAAFVAVAMALGLVRFG